MTPETTRTDPEEADDRTETEPGVTLDPPYGSGGRDPGGHAAGGRRSGARTRRTERTLLELRVAALERTIERKEGQLQAVVDRYERVLADRERERRASDARDVGGVAIPIDDGSAPEPAGRVRRTVRRARAALGRLLP